MPDINAAYRWAIQKCNAPNVGYSMDYRDQQTVGGITYYDCSSFIWYALLAGGFDCVQAHGGNTWPFTTVDMRQVLENLGFVSVPLNGQILPGDIGFYDYGGGANGHTEMCYQGGVGSAVFMGAHGSSRPLADQVSINDYQSAGTRWQYIYRYQGGATGDSISLEVISAICGNWWGESQINPGIWESLTPTSFDHQYNYDGIGGYGLGQWTNVGTTHGRCWNLYQFLTSNGYAVDDGNGEIEFMIDEAYWTPTSIEQSAYSTLEEFLQSTSTDLYALTKEFMYHWEGINNGTLTTRYNNAQTVLAYLQAHLNDPDITQWYTGNRYLTTAETLNNCVMVARVLSSGFTPVSRGKFWIFLQRHWRRKRRLII